MVNWCLHFEDQVHQRGRETAVINDGRHLTYAELNARAAAVANWLLEHDYDRLAMYMPNRAEFFVGWFGALKAGAVAVPINYMFGESMVEYVVEDADIDAVLTAAGDVDDIAPLLETTGLTDLVTIGAADAGTTTLEDILDEYPRIREAVPRSDDDLMSVLYTSGTTGMPKGVRRTHGAATAYSTSTAHNWKMTGDQTWLCAGPVYHSTGLGASSLALLQRGGTVILHTWSVEDFLAEVEQHRPDVGYIAGSMLLDLAEYETPEEWDVSSLRQLMIGGAPMREQDYRQVAETYDVQLAERLGMTEAGLVLVHPVGQPGHYTPRDEQSTFVPGACGLPNEHALDVRVVSLDDGEPIETGEGEMQVRGDSLFDGYLNQPETTAAAFTDDGWYKTGDIMRVDEDGYYYHVRRADDMIVSGGENVYPHRIEDVLEDHEAVLEAAIFSVPDDYWGERVCAAIVPGDDGLTEDDLSQYCKDSGELSAYEVPKSFFMRDELPKTPTKSVRREDLSEEYADA